MNEKEQAQHDVDWTVERRALWQRLRDYRFGGDQAEAFLDRVGHALGCDRAGAEAALEEYRRFCFLAVAAEHPVTPSVRIDKVWHAHLTDTRDYWMRYCPQVLRRDLHHTPSLGGQAEDARHQEQYRQTVASYERFFDTPPPSLWPPPLPAPKPAQPARAQAYAGRAPLPSPWASEPRGGFVAVSLASVALALVYLTGVSTEGTPNPLDFHGGSFLALYVAALPWAYLAGTAIKRTLRGPNRRNAAQAEDSIELAYLAGGAERAADAALVELMQRDVLGLDHAGTPAEAAARPDRIWLRIDGARVRGESLPPSLRTAADIAQREQSLQRSLAALRRAYDPIAEQLRRKGWWLGRAADLRMRWLGSVPLAALALFGLDKIAVGLSRGRPVGFLVVLVGLTAIVALARLLREQPRTRAGDWALYDAHQRPRGTELGVQVALMGTIGLYGSGYADYHTLRTPPSASGSSDSSSSSGGGCSSGGSSCGGGGGGCGGCGGS